MKQTFAAFLCVLLLSGVAFAEKNPLVGMWMLQDSEGKAAQSDLMGAALGVFSPRVMTFTEKSMEVNGQLQRVEYEISGNDVIVWVDKAGSRFVVTGNTMKMLVPNPMTGKTFEVPYVRTTKEQAAAAAKRAEAQAKVQVGEKAKAREKEALAQLQGRWKAELIEEDGQGKYEQFAMRQSTQQGEVIFLVKGDQFLSFENGMPTPFFSFSVNPSPDQKTLDSMFLDAKHIDVKFASGSMKGQSRVGLYHLVNFLGAETLVVCLAKPGDRQRPRALGTERGDGRLCLTLVRSDLPGNAPVASVAPSPSPSPKAPDLRYLAELPDPQKVLAGISGKDGMDAVARQVGAFEILAKVVKIRSEGRVYRNALTPDEGAKYRGYLDNQQRLITEQNGQFDPNCQGAQCDRTTFFRLYNEYGMSKEFRQEVFDRFLSKQWQEEHRSFEAK